MANRNRVMGHTAERDYASDFRALGFPNCKTTRETSTLLDSCKVDLSGIPFNIQIKAGKQTSLNCRKVICDMKEKLLEFFPERLDLLKCVIHHIKGKQGKVRLEEDALVTMTVDDFYKLINKAYNGK